MMHISKQIVILLCIPLAFGSKVDVRFYGESLCPDCTGFTTTTIKALFETQIPLITNFRYIGWGNVRKSGDAYSCQHGPLECKMNTVLNCAQELSKDQFQFFEYLYCIESQAGPGVDDQIPGCAKLAGLKLESLEKCYQGEQGQKLDAAAHNETDGLQPPHTYVPWVTVNGQPIFDAIDNLGVIICAAYDGRRPEACSQAGQAQLRAVGKLHQDSQPVEPTRANKFLLS